MERFVQAITGGGLSLVAGLWLLTLFPTGAVPYLMGIVFVGVGIGGLAGGIWVGLEVP